MQKLAMLVSSKGGRENMRDCMREREREKERESHWLTAVERAIIYSRRTVV